MAATGLTKGARAEASALSLSYRNYIFFSEHFLEVSSHTPPALSQLALSVAFVTSPAKGGAGHGKRQGHSSVPGQIRMDKECCNCRCRTNHLRDAIRERCSCSSPGALDNSLQRANAFAALLSF